MEYYRQCELKQGNLRTTAWVPESGARIGYSFLFKDAKEDGRWLVVSVSDMRILRDEVGKSNVFGSIK